MSKSKPKRLTPKMLAAIDDYMIHGNGAQAARAGGTAENQGKYRWREWMKMPHFVAEIERRRAELAEKSQVTAEYVVETIRETVERCRQTVSPVLDRKGEQVMVENRDGELVPAFTFDANNVLKGSELLGKHLGMFQGKNPQDGGGVKVEITQYAGAAPAESKAVKVEVKRLADD